MQINRPIDGQLRRAFPFSDAYWFVFRCHVGRVQFHIPSITRWTDRKPHCFLLKSYIIITASFGCLDCLYSKFTKRDAQKFSETLKTDRNQISEADRRGLARRFLCNFGFPFRPITAQK